MSTDPSLPREDEIDLSVRDVPRSIYAFFYNKKTGLFLILLMGVLTLLGTLFPQAPDAMQRDPQAMAAWVESMRPRYRGLTGLLGFLGVFHMFSTWLFRIATLALALSILACTAHRFPTLWRQARHPHTHVKPSFFTHARLHDEAEIATAPQALLERTQTHLRHVGFRTVAEPRGEGYALYADRFRWSPFGTIIAHLAFIIILIGVFVTSTAGFRMDDVSVPVGGSVEVGHGTGLTIEARSFTDTYQPDGRPKDYASDLAVHKDGHEVAQHVVRVNSPMHYDGVSINQASYGLAAQVSVARPDGSTQTAVVPLTFSSDDGTETYGTFTLQPSGTEVYVAAPASGSTGSRLSAGQVRVELYEPKANTPVARQVLTQGTPANVAGMTMMFDRESQYTGLMVAKDPGAWLVWLGSFLIMLGTCLSMFFRNHRLWVEIQPTPSGSRFQIASPDRHDSTFERRVRDLVSSLRTTPAKEPLDA